jgi:hypothetical protein
MALEAMTPIYTSDISFFLNASEGSTLANLKHNEVQRTNYKTKLYEGYDSNINRIFV